MNRIQTLNETVFEGHAPVSMGRFVDPDGNALLIANLTSIDYEIFDLDADDPRTPLVASTSLTIGDVWNDTLQTANAWTKDSTGYNFRATRTDADLLTVEAGHRWQVVYKITTNDFGILWLIHTGPVQSVRGYGASAA